MSFRIGMGYDIHRLVPGDGVILGGILIPCVYRLEGHSDADCLTHAIMDALLGALGLEDIGHFFPNTDNRYLNIDSQKLLSEVMVKVGALGYSICNIDACIIAEAPKILPYVDDMKKILAQTMGITPAQIGIKATTSECLGALGRKEGIAAQAVALLTR